MMPIALLQLAQAIHTVGLCRLPAGRTAMHGIKDGNAMGLIACHDHRRRMPKTVAVACLHQCQARRNCRQERLGR